jgi:hypothetical protein
MNIDEDLLDGDFVYLYWIHLPEHDDITKQGYVGYTKDYNKRMKDHTYSYKHYTETGQTHHPCLYQAFDKYGIENMVSEVVFYGDKDSTYSMEALLRAEPYVGWNVVKGGNVGNRGVALSEETKRKISIAKTGQKQSAETIRKRVKSRAGYCHSEETKAKMSKSISEAMRLKHTPEERSERSRRAAQTAKANGYVQTAETQRKKSEAMKKYGLASSVIAKGQQHLQDVKNDLGQYGRAFHPKHKYLYECPHGIFGELNTVAELEGKNSPAAVRLLFNSEESPEFVKHKRGTDEYWECLKKLRDLVPDEVLEKYAKYEERVWQGYQGDA